MKLQGDTINFVFHSYMCFIAKIIVVNVGNLICSLYTNVCGFITFAGLHDNNC